MLPHIRDFVEVNVLVKADYGTVYRKVAEVLQLEAPYEECTSKLFQTDGTIVSS